MSDSILVQLFWFVVLILGPVLCVISAVILLRERYYVVWFMLVGGVLFMVSESAQCVLQSIQWMGNLNVDQIMQWMQAIGVVSHGGFLMFAVSLLLYALRQRAKANRIAELEAIIASMQGQR